MPSAANDSREKPASSNNFIDSKSNWLFGSGFPILLGFMRVFRLRERTVFGRSLLKFSPKFSQNARSILKFNMWSITQVVVRGRTRNRFVLNRARGFESHHLSRKKSTGSGWCFFVSNRISPSFKKYVSIIFAQSLLKRIDKMNCRFTARTRSPLTPLPPVRHSLLFPVAGT